MLYGFNELPSWRRNLVNLYLPYTSLSVGNITSSSLPTGSVSPNSPAGETDPKKKIYIANAQGYVLEVKLVVCYTYDGLDSSNYPGWLNFKDWAQTQGVTLSSADGAAFPTALNGITTALYSLTNVTKLRDMGFAAGAGAWLGKTEYCNDGDGKSPGIWLYDNGDGPGTWNDNWLNGATGATTSTTPLLLVRPL